VTASQQRVLLSIGVVAAAVLAGLFALRRAGVDERLFTVLAVGGGALVTVLVVTYRALTRIVEAARAAPQQAVPDDDEDDA
jgi:hypothetical protein